MQIVENRQIVIQRYERLINPLKCCICNSTKTYIKKVYGASGIFYHHHWNFIGEEVLCQSCFDKVKYHSPEYQRKYYLKRVIIGGKQVFLSDQELVFVQYVIEKQVIRLQIVWEK